MSYQYRSNTDKIIVENQLGIEFAIRLALEDAIRIAEPMTPKKTGELRASAQVLESQGVVNWTAPYAVYQENKQYTHYTTPGTGPHFAEKALMKVDSQKEKYLRQAGVIK